MVNIRIHRYHVEPANLDKFATRRAELIDTMRSKHPGLTETLLIDLGEGAYIDTWRWQSPEQMRAAFADAPSMPEIPAAMSLTHDAWGAETRSSCRDGRVFVDEAAEEVVPLDATSALLRRA